MAKGGDKRRLDENSKHLAKLRFWIAVSNGAFLVGRLFLQRQSVTTWHYVALGLTTLAYGFCFLGIKAALSPHYAPSGELIYSGDDLKTGGVLEYYHDILYLALGAQLVGSYTDWGWLVCLAVPAYAVYVLMVNVLLPMLETPAAVDVPEGEAERKKREKRERQAARAEKFARR